MAGDQGRPTKYEPDTDEKAKKFLAKGHSVRACSAHLGVCEDTIHEWRKVHKSFSEAIKMGVNLGLVYLEELMLACAAGSKKNISLRALELPLRTRFHEIYSEKQRIEQDISIKAFEIVPYEQDSPISETD